VVGRSGDFAGRTAASADAAIRAYDQLAPAYDDLTQDYEYDRWVSELVRWARRRGLHGLNVLDVACGTGKSFLPLVALGFRVTGCDASTGMLDVAASRKTGAALHLADMRDLPDLGHFDFITCLDDSINHLLTHEDVSLALSGMARGLRPNGMLVFDVNTLRGFREAWAACEIVELDRRVVLWRGLGDAECRPGALVALQIDVFTSVARGPAGWSRVTATIHERHYPPAEIERLALEAGLSIVARRGQSPGIRLSNHLDEAVHTKALYLLRRADTGAPRPHPRIGGR
jgi:SAM-dependent methyltransferase